MKHIKGLITLVLFAGPGLAQGVTLDVCTTCSYQAIADAVAAAAPGDEIYIQSGTYNEHNLVVDIPLTFFGDGPQATIIDAQSNGRHFSVLESAVSVEFREMALVNGNPAGAGGCAPFTSSDMGGAICAGAVSMKLWKMRLENNTANRYGGAIVMYGRDASSTSVGRLMVGKSVFDSNQVTGQNAANDAAGGAIACSYCANIQLFRNGFRSNQALFSYSPVKGAPAVRAGTGGAIASWGGDHYRSARNTFRDNKARDGGAVAMGYSVGFNHPARFINDTYAENRAQYGGAVAGFNGSLPGELRIKRSTFHANKAEEGGAITSSAPVYVNNSTFSGNHAETAGGAIAMTRPYIPYAVSNSTFHGNSVDQAQGGSVLFIPALLVSGDIAVFNSIMSENVGDECSPTPVNDFVIGEHNLTETNSCDPNNGSASAPFGLNDPFSLGAVTDFDTNLGNNGGFTATHAIGSQSNAVDNGANNCPGAVFGISLPRDQRGMARVNNCDIGSFEYQ